MTIINGNFSDEETVLWPTLPSGHGSLSTHAPLAIIRKGHLVTLSGLVSTPASVASGTLLFILPVGFRPSATVPLVGKTDGPGIDEDVVIEILSDGTIRNQYRVINNYYYVNSTFHILNGS